MFDESQRVLVIFVPMMLCQLDKRELICKFTSFIIGLYWGNSPTHNMDKKNMVTKKKTLPIDI